MFDREQADKFLELLAIGDEEKIQAEVERELCATVFTFQCIAGVHITLSSLLDTLLRFHAATVMKGKEKEGLDHLTTTLQETWAKYHKDIKAEVDQMFDRDVQMLTAAFRLQVLLKKQELENAKKAH